MCTLTESHQAMWVVCVPGICCGDADAARNSTSPDSVRIEVEIDTCNEDSLTGGSLLRSPQRTLVVSGELPAADQHETAERRSRSSSFKGSLAWSRQASAPNALQTPIADREALSALVAADASPPSPCCVSASIEELEVATARKKKMHERSMADEGSDDSRGDGLTENTVMVIDTGDIVQKVRRETEEKEDGGCKIDDDDAEALAPRVLRRSRDARSSADLELEVGPPSSCFPQKIVIFSSV